MSAFFGKRKMNKPQAFMPNELPDDEINPQNPHCGTSGYSSQAHTTQTGTGQKHKSSLS
jgi:hypothetical protein